MNFCGRRVLPKIAKLDELLLDFLGANRKITNQESSYLTEKGENYGSLLLSLRIHTESKSKIEVFETVVKLPPPNEFLREEFNTPITFRNELHFYKAVIPQMESFLRDKNLGDFLDCFPKFMGGRLSLQSNKKYADKNAVIVLENLKTSGYVTANRKVGYALEPAKLILRALAKFHATPLALKLQRPEIFQNLITPISTQFKVFECEQSMLDTIVDMNLNIINGIKNCRQHADKFLAAFKAYQPIAKNTPEYIREPFATIIHTDAWITNFMIRFQSQKPQSCKIVDFQLVEYGSPARDIIYFLFTSVEIPILQKNFDELIEFYFKNFIDDLAKMGCDVAAFTRQKFDEEMVLAAKEFEFVHCMVMLKTIFATKKSLKNLEDYEAADWVDYEDVSQEYKDRTAFILTEFIKKKWI